MKVINFTSNNLNRSQSTYILSSLLFSVEIVEFYFNTRLNIVELMLLNSFDEYEKVINTKRSSAGVTIFKNGTIYAYNPFFWTLRKNNHTTSDFKSSLIHELVHLHFYLLNSTPPLWIKKGLGVYLSTYSQVQKKKRESWFVKLLVKSSIPNIFTFKNSFEQHQYPLLCYLTAYKYVEYISTKYGKFGFIDNSFEYGENSKSWREFTKHISTHYKID